MTALVPTTFSYELVAEDYQATLMETAERIRGRYRSARRDILEIGRDLLATKAELDHGLFLGWIEAEFKWSERTAQSYMQAAREWGEVQNRDAVADLPVKLLYDLSAEANADIKAEVIADLDSGKPVDVPAVKAKIKRAKKARKPVSQAAAKRRDREEAERHEEIVRREAEQKAHAAEIVGILRKLPEQDFERLLELLTTASLWVVQGMLNRGRA
jgi:hypothetical protein